VEKGNTVKYDVFTINGHRPFGRGIESVDEIGDEIREVYSLVAGNGGKIVTSHTVICTLGIDPESEYRDLRYADCLFLVAEMPDDYSPGA
jgi:hypothetical protein